MITVKRLGADWPRRNCVDMFTPAEKAIWEAGQEVEKAGADPLLTEAGQLLQQARDKVGEYVDKQLTAA